MQTIATKIAAVKTVFAAAFPDADDKFISHAIHGVGDSPRRARRLAKRDPKALQVLAKAYTKAITTGVPHVKAVQAGSKAYLTKFPPKAAESDESGESEAE